MWCSAHSARLGASVSRVKLAHAMDARCNILITRTDSKIFYSTVVVSKLLRKKRSCLSVLTRGQRLEHWNRSANTRPHRHTEGTKAPHRPHNNSLKQKTKKKLHDIVLNWYSPPQVISLLTLYTDNTTQNEGDCSRDPQALTLPRCQVSHHY